MTGCTLLDDPTDELLAWHDAVVARHDDAFAAAKELAPRLGAHLVDGRAEVGFWTPQIADRVPASDVYLEVLTATEDVDPGAVADRTVRFRRERVPLRRNGEYHWGVVDGLRPGTRQTLGSLYRLAYRAPESGDADDTDGWAYVHDPLAVSLPFGAFAPAEFYDRDRLDRERPDRAYFESLGTDEERVSTTEDDGLPRIDPATSVLEVHPGTASEAGSLAGLARRYEEIGRKRREGEELTSAERAFAGYDAMQVMPVEPLTENPETGGYWRPEGGDGDATATATGPAPASGDEAEDHVTVSMSRPDMVNWGYDIVVSGFAAPNPAVLETGRPDELVDFIAALHSLPRPVKVVFDVALGHAENRAVELLPEQFFLGPGMYGQHLDYRHPVVRAILLELQRRKMDFGADAIRVDGAQDFTVHDSESGEMVHDDAFLAEMDAVVQEVAGTEYRPWMIFEDGRPWPREDWELASTYRALIEQHPHSYQWSPVTFAHNTPALLTFWATKWWRVREVADFGGQWLTGVANHDTVRRGTQIDPTVAFNQSPVNPYLGETLPDALDEAYDGAAASMLFHCLLPGVPMDFLNANLRAPWGFVRDTDAAWNVKVVADEAHLLDWQVRERDYDDPAHFRRLKTLGFESLAGLASFVRALAATVDATDYDLPTMAAMLSATPTPLATGRRDTGDDPDTGARDVERDLSPDDLRAFGYAWMRDVHEFANLSNWTDARDDERTAFDLAVREFRHARPWLGADLNEGAGIERDPAAGRPEHFAYRHPTDGTVLYYGLRESPAGDEQVLFAGNMEGVPVEVAPETLPVPDLPTEGWEVALAAPDVESVGERDGTGPGGEGDGDAKADDGDASHPLRLPNGRAVVWTREP